MIAIRFSNVRNQARTCNKINPILALALQPGRANSCVRSDEGGEPSSTGLGAVGIERIRCCHKPYFLRHRPSSTAISYLKRLIRYMQKSRKLRHPFRDPRNDGRDQAKGSIYRFRLSPGVNPVLSRRISTGRKNGAVRTPYASTATRTRPLSSTRARENPDRFRKTAPEPTGDGQALPKSGNIAAYAATLLPSRIIPASRNSAPDRTGNARLPRQKFAA